MTGRASLRAGDVVRVRSADEILSTLDEHGRLDGMPFMPEMLQFCGQTLPVYKRADKTCDTTHSSGLRRLRDTVHLADLRCDGSAHGGCQAGCLLYWNERWLERGTGGAIGRGTLATPGAVIDDPTRAAPTGGSAAPAPPGRAVVTTADLARLATVATSGPDAAAMSGEDAGVRYVCQATEVFAATTALPWWDPTQYVRDVVTGNATVREVITGIVRWLAVRVQWRINHSGVPLVKGRLTSTPRQQLDLRPGERVRIKSRKEIEATLDTENRNRGLRLDADMMLFCGREFRVLRRINRIIDERTGRMTDIPGDCIVLDGATCTGQYNRCCPRSDYPYWREIWLTRADEAGPSADGSATTPGGSTSPAVEVPPHP